MEDEIIVYNKNLGVIHESICNILANTINNNLVHATCKLWHAHPVWFLDGNPVVGYSKQKAGLRLMFWSGADFEEDALIPTKGKFKDASIFYTDVQQIDTTEVARWLQKAIDIQWDYKNIVKRKGQLIKLF